MICVLASNKLIVLSPYSFTDLMLVMFLIQILNIIYN